VMIAMDYLDLADPDRAAQWVAVAEGMPGRETRILSSKSVVRYLQGEQNGAVAAAEQAYDLAPDGEAAPGFARQILYRHLVAERDFDSAIMARFGAEGLPVVPEKGKWLPANKALQTAAASFLIIARDGREAGHQFGQRVLEWVESVDVPEYQRNTADLVRCLAYAGLEQPTAAVSACRSAFERDQQWVFLYWQIMPGLDPIRDTPEWQAFMNEIAAGRQQQLARFRASGEEPKPH
jgi:hypothetical protein